MTDQEAIAVVEKKRSELRIRRNMEVSSAEKAIVEYIKDRSKPGRVEDRIAWIIEMANSEGFVRVHVDDRTGDILEVLRTA